MATAMFRCAKTVSHFCHNKRQKNVPPPLTKFLVAKAHKKIKNHHAHIFPTLWFSIVLHGARDWESLHSRKHMCYTAPMHSRGFEKKRFSQTKSTNDNIGNSYTSIVFKQAAKQTVLNTECSSLAFLKLILLSRSEQRE